MEEKRNVLTESARIVWGKIKDIKDVKAADLDAVIIPGGFGAVKNLSTFATEGVNFKVNPEVERLLKEMLAAKKPIGSICITPVIIAKIAGQQGMKPKLTIGTDEGTAKAIETLGATHVPAQVTDVVVDQEYKIVTSPAYILAKSISEVADGIEKVVTELIALIGK